MSADPLYLPERLRWSVGKGLLVRSKEEARIARVLLARGIRFEYERRLYAPDHGSSRLPDFTIWDRHGRMFFLEHLGVLSDPGYRQRWRSTSNWYARHYPGRLLVTFGSAGLLTQVERVVEAMTG